MSKTNKGKAPACRRAQQRNWSWCQLNNARGQLRAVVTDCNNVMLESEKHELREAILVMEKFFDANDNATNWEKKKYVENMAASCRSQAEEF